MFKAISKIKPAYFFIITAPVFFVLYMLLSPPLQQPDEYNHFYRIYRIAQGDLLPHQEDKRLGGQIPLSFQDFLAPFNSLNSNQKSKVAAKDVLRSFTVECRPDLTEFKDFPNTCYYSPVSYLPQALACFVCVKLNCSVGAMYYLEKLFVFIVWLLAVFYAIKIIPIGKWLLTFVSLLPMQLYVSASLSADTVTNLLSFLWLALVLKYALSDEPISKKQIYSLAAVACLLALAKVVYVALVLLFFLIPPSRFASRRHYFFSLAIVAAPALLLAIAWLNVVAGGYLSYYTYNASFRHLATLVQDADYNQQKQYLAADPTRFLKVLINSLTLNPGFYLVSYVGFFGAFMDTPLPDITCILAYVLIFVLAFGETNEKILSLRQRVVLLLTVVAVLAFLFLSQYLTWSPVKSEGIDKIQGRYFFPIFPLVFLLFTGAVKQFKWIAALPVIPAVAWLNFEASNLLYDCYFKETFKSRTEFYCDAEEQGDNNTLKTSDPAVQLNCNATVSEDEHHGGKHSILVSREAPFACEYHFKSFEPGDWLMAEVFCKGEGRISLHGADKTGADYYVEEFDTRYTEPGGWHKIKMVRVMDKKMQGADFEIRVFIKGGSKAYFDDLHIDIKHY